jgi:hypothetical protein
MQLDRLRRMSRDELRWRTSVAIRTARGRAAARIWTSRWNRGDLVQALAPDLLDPDVHTQITGRQWHAVHESLEARIRSRPARFVLDPSTTTELRSIVAARWPAAEDDARVRADRVLAGSRDILGYRGLRFAGADGAVDWHLDPVHARRAPRSFYADVPYLDPAVGDHKIIWEINRHQHWLALGRAAWLTGDPRYARAIRSELQSWLAANPPLTGINWASMLEIGLRSISWTWALHCLLGRQVRSAEPTLQSTSTAWVGSGGGSTLQVGSGSQPDPASPWLVDMFVGLHHQLTHVERNLSYYFSPNTHLTGEALALYVVGTALPELAASARWAATGRRILLDEIDRQIDSDGGHAERSTHYQRYTLDFYLLALLTARLARDHAAAARFEEVARRLAEFTRAIADDNGRLPLIGDDDGGMLWPVAGRSCNDVRDSLSLAAIVLDRPTLAPWGVMEEAVWIAGPEAVHRHATGRRDARIETPASRAFAGTGYFVARDGRGGHAVFDAGPHGYMNGGHAHADALSLTLALDGRPLLIDPGTFTYTCDPAMRDRLRSSMSHNTVTIDGRSQSVPAGPFHWRTRVDGRMHGWRHNPAFDWFEASHDGYAPLQHRRTVMRAGSGWLVADEILDRGAHTAAAHWHFDPAWTVTREAGRVRATHEDGSVAWLVHDAGDATLYHGDEAAGLGWYAPVYGVLVPSWSARIEVAGDGPLMLITWIGGNRDIEAPLVQRVIARCDGADPVIAAKVTGRTGQSVFLLQPGRPATHAAHRCRVAEVETDARALHYRTEGTRAVSLDLVDARFATPTRADSLSIESDEPVADLHLRAEEGIVDLLASVPPARLRVRGAAAFHRLRLNGRELPLSGAATPDLLLIHSADWRDTAPDMPLTRPWLDSGAGFAQH